MARAFWIRVEQRKMWNKLLVDGKGQGNKRKSKKGISNRSRNVKWQGNPPEVFSFKGRGIKGGKKEKNKEKGCSKKKKIIVKTWTVGSKWVVPVV